MIVQNVLMYAGLNLVDLMIVAQSRIVLPTEKHVLICSSEVRQQLSQLTYNRSRIQEQPKFVKTTPWSTKLPSEHNG